MDFEIRYYLGDEMFEKIFTLTASHDDDLAKILNSAKKRLISIFGEKRFVLLRVKSFNSDSFKGKLPKSISDRYYKTDVPNIATPKTQSSIKKASESEKSKSSRKKSKVGKSSLSVRSRKNSTSVASSSIKKSRKTAKKMSKS